MKNILIYIFSFLRCKPIMLLLRLIIQRTKSNRLLNIFDPNTIRRVRAVKYSPNFETINYKNIQLTVDVNDHIGYVSYMRNRPFELAILDVAKYIGLSSDDSILDVGANIGSASVPAAALIGCEIIAIEPSSDNLQLLLVNLKQNNIRALVLKFAITGKSLSDTYLQLFDRIGNSGAKSLNPNWNAGIAKNEKSECVPTRTIDQLYKANNQFNATKIMKIDVEGLEYEVITGAIEFIEKVRPYIIMEYRIDISIEAKEGLQKCIEFLEKFYRVEVIDDHFNLLPFEFDTSYENILLSPK